MRDGLVNYRITNSRVIFEFLNTLISCDSITSCLFLQRLLIPRSFKTLARMPGEVLKIIGFNIVTVGPYQTSENASWALTFKEMFQTLPVVKSSNELTQVLEIAESSF